MFTKEQRPIRIYKVFFENTKTGTVDYILMEGTSSEEVSSTVLMLLGNDYDLIKTSSVKASDLN